MRKLGLTDGCVERRGGGTIRVQRIARLGRFHRRVRRQLGQFAGRLELHELERLAVLQLDDSRRGVVLEQHVLEQHVLE
ncbi:MAG TPA: hypothetical protein VEK07_24085 [Polyangiaceae bacterium]|nr:hypothetical protein [Polyangiaceae bacterium]